VSPVGAAAARGNSSGRSPSDGHEHHGKIRDVHLRTPFADDPTRGELGKALAMRIVPELRAPDDTNLTHDSSTNALIRRYRYLRA
jgi:hypothetical protein